MEPIEKFGMMQTILVFFINSFSNIFIDLSDNPDEPITIPLNFLL